MTILKRVRAVSGLVASLLSICGWTVTCRADDSALTQLELKWLEAADPVLQYAVDQGLPIDVVVRPNNSAEAPYSIGVEGGRCKLILAMRNRTDAEATLADVPEVQHGTLIEAMTAHEVAHCWRYNQGLWQAMPLGVPEPLSFANEELAKQRRAMRAVQSEEAFADLVALAWIQRHHAAKYEFVHAWLARVRKDQPVDGSFHDTRAWLELAKSPVVFISNSSPFDQVQDLWVDGLKATAGRF
jgi:hypothetical protein